MTDDTARVRAYEADRDRINDLRQGDDTQADVIRRLLDDDGDPPFDQPREDTAREVVAVLRDELGIEGDADIDELVKGEYPSTNLHLPPGYGKKLKAETAPDADVPEGLRAIADVDVDMDVIKEQLDTIQSSTETVEERTGKLERLVEEMKR